MESCYERLRSTYAEIDLGSVYTNIAAELVYQTIGTWVAIESEGHDMRMTNSIEKFTRLLVRLGHRSEISKSPRGLEHAIDAACKIAMILITKKQAVDRVFVALDTQYALVKRALEKNSGGYKYYELRLMLRLAGNSDGTPARDDVGRRR